LSGFEGLGAAVLLDLVGRPVGFLLTVLGEVLAAVSVLVGILLLGMLLAVSLT
jgi:hypothetical protein